MASGCERLQNNWGLQGINMPPALVLGYSARRALIVSRALVRCFGLFLGYWPQLLSLVIRFFHVAARALEGIAPDHRRDL